MIRARIEVRCRPGVLDPQAKAVKEALERLGFEGLGPTHVGKLIQIDLPTDDADEAARMAETMCTRLLAHPVTEDYAFTLEPTAAAGGIQ